MSFYAMLHGENEFAADVLCDVFSVEVEADPEKAAAEVRNLKARIPRYRDAFITAEKNLAIHTRTGGNNRESYEYRPAGADPDALYNEDLMALPGYITNCDASHDNTFATFLFAPKSERLKRMLDTLDPGLYVAEDPSARFAKVIEELQNAKEGDTMTIDGRRALEAGKKIADCIMGTLNNPTNDGPKIITL